MKTWIVVLSVDGETSSQVVEAESSGFALRAALDALPASTDSRTVFVRVTRNHANPTAEADEILCRAAQAGGYHTVQQCRHCATRRGWVLA